MPHWLKKFTLVLLIWLAVIALADIPRDWVSDYWAFSLLGVVGAIFANATGAGGGVVFVPFFNHLGLSATQTVATSFAIQCCGMTAGAITWYQLYRQSHRDNAQWSSLPMSVLWAVPAAALGIVAAQFGGIAAPGGVNVVFAVFSIALALAIFASVAKSTNGQTRTRLANQDKVALTAIGFFGGLITAWLSVGVGELIAVYLIMRGFNVTLSIAVAVIVSAFAVWFGVVYHGVVSQAIYLQIVMFAGLGAVLGGIVAKFVVLAFSPMRLKLFFASWVLLLGVSGLPLF